MSSQRLFGILILAVVALAAIPRESSGAPLVVGQDYHSVQLLSGTSVAVLQESLARVAGEPYARIDKRGAGYALRVGYWDSRAEAVQAAKALLPKFRDAHARIATYRPDAIVAGAGEQSSRAAAPVPSVPEASPRRIGSAQSQTQRPDMRGWQPVVGQDYYSVQLLSGTSAAVLQESRALVADQPYVRIEKRGAEYMLRVGYWESRDEAVQAAKVLSPKFRGAHTRIAPYQPEVIVAGIGEQSSIASAPPPSPGARAPDVGTRETTAQAGARSQAAREAATLAAERAEAERRAEAAAQERSAAEALALREAAIRQQAEAQAEAAARERVAAEREAMAQAVLREKAEAEALRLAESRRDAERRAATVALERSAAEERAAQEAAAKAQAQREAERVAQEESAEQTRLIELAKSRERAEAEALRLAESRRDAGRRPAPEVTPLRTEPEQSQAQLPRMPRGPQLVVGQDYHSVQLLSGTSVAVFQESLALVADQPYARIDKRGAAYALRVGYWDTRAEAVQAAKALSRKFRGAHARIATYRPDAIVVWNAEQASQDSAPVPSTPEAPPPGMASAGEQPAQASAPVPSAPEGPPPGVASAAEQPPKASAPVPSTPRLL
ncbi:MAG: SPOR domain-containing protein [Betaproteobacteria bacterium]|nr:SPOR domain-containing protein [Betaproteobacteria bacterium]